MKLAKNFTVFRKALQNCGGLAADFLAERIEGQRIECAVASIDDYGRSIASCNHEGEDLSGWMVREGYALAFVGFSDRYVAEELAARASEAGLIAQPDVWKFGCGPIKHPGCSS